MENVAEAAQSAATSSDGEKPVRPPLGGPAIVADGLGIQFRANRKKRRSLRDRLMRRPLDVSRESFWAVRDASFTIRHGESVALLGYNGSGKSTLLKLIAGVLLPDAGSVTLDGRVAPLLELGAGFAKDLSGRENIYLSGVIQGMTREQMEERFEDIVRFSGIRRFIDTPVKHYSSGMKVRLGFAITAQLPHPILLLDEVLAVGDRRFKRKCYRRIDRLVEEGRTMVLVSHSERDVRRLCDRVLYLQDGRIIMDGGVDEVFERYNADSEDDS